MSNERLLNFGEFYLEESVEGVAEEEDIEFISKELMEAEIEVEKSEETALELIRKAKVEVKIENGRIFKKKFYESLGNIKSLLPQIEKDEPQLATAFRKLEGKLDDLLDDKEKMLLLEYIRKTKKE
ncbi:MAG: hypothetical protein WCS69_16450 [Ignavibacteriaceae bacterium]|jgi:hypothetical protein